jgi:hypothetical protein
MEKQREALQFVADNAFKLPAFWKNEEVLKRVGYDFYLDSVARFGTRPLNALLSADRIDRMIKFQTAGLETFSPVALFNEVKSAIFEELGDRRPDVSAYRRHLQAAMVNLLIDGVEAPSDGDDAVSEDFRSLCRSTLADLQEDLERVGSRNSGTLTGIHFQNLADKAADALDVD